MKLKIKRSYFAFPYFFLSAVFVVIPLLILLYYSFTAKAGGFTFKNFGNFFSQKETMVVMLRSFYIAFLTTIISLAIAYPLSMILANSKINKSAILVLMFVLPMWINSIMRTYAVKFIFDIFESGGAKINSYIKVVTAMVYDFFPFMLLPLYTVQVNMDKSYVEAANDLGASPFKTFLKIKLPLSVPGIVSGVLMVFMPTVSTFAISDIVAQSPDMYLLGNLINNYFEKGLYNQGSAYAFILLAIIAITMFVANKLSNGKAMPQAKNAGGVI